MFLSYPTLHTAWIDWFDKEYLASCTFTLRGRSNLARAVLWPNRIARFRINFQQMDTNTGAAQTSIYLTYFGNARYATPSTLGSCKESNAIGSLTISDVQLLFERRYMQRNLKHQHDRPLTQHTAWLTNSAQRILKSPFTLTLYKCKASTVRRGNKQASKHLGGRIGVVSRWLQGLLRTKPWLPYFVPQSKRLRHHPFTTVSKFFRWLQIG